MAINKQTIISAFDDKLTLLQWLKTINKALDEAVLTGVEVRQKGNATFSFVVTFEDGTELVSNDFVLAQGESINGATIRNGHLYLSLTNGDELDAGNLKPVTSFEINTSQHLIVNYGDGTSQDLGAIFSGNVNIDGNFTANSIIENMSGYSFEKANNNDKFNFNYVYASIVKNGNKLTFVCYFQLEMLQDVSALSETIYFGKFKIPSNISNKLYPTGQGTFAKALGTSNIIIMPSTDNLAMVQGHAIFVKGANDITLYMYNREKLNNATTYNVRFETTLLLNDSLAV